MERIANLKNDHKKTGRTLPKYCYFVPPRDGRKARYVFRHKGVNATIKAKPGTDDFDAQYDAIIDNHPALRARNIYSRRKKVASVYTPSQVTSGLLSKCRTRANRKGVAMNIDREWILQTLRSQRFRCSVSGLEFDLSAHRKGSGKAPRKPSVDRIDPSGGYTRENCRIVCAIVNLALLDWEYKDFKIMCEAVAKNG